MEIKLLSNVSDISLPDLLQPNGIIKLLPTAELDAIPSDSLALWCHRHGRYGVPTQELIAWLKNYIGDRKTIEIGAGNGDLAHYLGIPATDSKIQQRPDIQRIYHQMRQPTINYPDWVEELDAEAAVAKYRPEIVIGSWVTQWVRNPNLPARLTGGGSVYAVKEFRIIKQGIIYLLIGHTEIHGRKTIMRQPHVNLTLPFLRSRKTDDVAGNRIYIWNDKNKVSSSGTAHL